MKEEFEKYLLDIGVDTSIHFERIKELLRIAKMITPEDEEIEDIFIEDSIEENRRAFMHLEFFTKHYALASDDFMSSSNISILRLQGNLWSSRLRFKDYDFVKASADSRLRISSVDTTSGTLAFSLEATGKNCNHLLRIYKKYFMPGRND